MHAEDVVLANSIIVAIFFSAIVFDTTFDDFRKM